MTDGRADAVPSPLGSPQDRAVARYLHVKGLGHAHPVGVESERVDDRWTWLYDFELPSGEPLTLLVCWDAITEQWDVKVYDFHR